MSESKVCGAVSPSGWLCVLAHGHEGEHMSIDNKRSWKGSPGRPLFWVDAPRQEDKNPAVRRPILQNKPKFTGRPCPQCGSLNTIPNGRCLLCLEPGCGHSGECA